MKSKSKVVLSVSIDKKLSEIMKKEISNKSRYIEWLIYQDLKANNIDGIEKIII